MTRRLVISLSLAVAAITVGSAAATHEAPSAKPTLISTKGAIEALAMDGRRVAYDLEARSSCNTLHVWDTVSKQDVVVSGAGTCGADSTSTGAGVREIAVAGSRISWIVNLGGNTESADTLYAATVGGAKEKKLASALRTGDVDGVLNGTWIGNLAGDGDLTALQPLEDRRRFGHRCERRQAEGGPRRLCAREPTRYESMSVDSGRIAVLDPQGVVKIYAANGIDRLELHAERRGEGARPAQGLRSCPLFPGALEISARRERGARRHDPRSPAARASLDVHANIAAFVVGKSIRAIRIATKKDDRRLPSRRRRSSASRSTMLGSRTPTTRSPGVKGIGKLAFVPLSLVQLKTA